jgi:hypothetical protein
MVLQDPFKIGFEAVKDGGGQDQRADSAEAYGPAGGGGHQGEISIVRTCSGWFKPKASAMIDVGRLTEFTTRLFAAAGVRLDGRG